ncbi:class A beta-lactamase [Mycobacterium vicinigordonae]|uniref:Beta-lactamase n=1 Tax=Mycobacterium vicinigordonae TaxID=1719132 RepID=A0A7D6E0F4_9MYCO|nr:class A beta-lactamase [Mycobacterium vicinigordonae]QLL05446.1 class A beta-lactamase [Mycobacterium vicinigordonae]
MGRGAVLISRRECLAAAALLPLAGCARRANGDPGTTTDPRPSFEELERRYDGRLGVYVPQTATTAAIAYRADERFAFCSTFKAPLVAAVLHRYPTSYLDQRVTYTEADINSISPVTEQHVDTGMTVGQLCDAAIRYSDGTAANLLLDRVDGPAGFTTYLRTLGDTVSRLDQPEPQLNRDAPGDERDTTTPRAVALVFQQLLLGDALPSDKRAMLTDWMTRNTTGAERIRAGFPADWKVADKTGSGDYGRANDVAVVWSPRGAAHVVAILTDRTGGGYDAEYREALIADAARATYGALIS